MRRKLAFLLSISCVLVVVPTTAQRAPDTTAGKRPMELADILAWKSIATTALSNNGQWMAYRLSPLEGDSEVVVRATGSDKTFRFPIGEIAAAGGAPGDGGGAAPATLRFSDDSKWVAFTSYPTRAEAARLKKQRKPLLTRVLMLDLTAGTNVAVDNVRRFAFSGERGGWIALHKAPAETGGPGGGAGGGAPAGPGAPAAASDKPKGTDLILRELATGRDLNIGNISEFAFDRSGRFLALVVDAADKAGNGIQLRNMERGTVAVLDSDKAGFEKLAWTEGGDGLAVLKSVDDKAWQDKLYSVIGYADLAGANGPRRISFDPKDDKAFPESMSISPDRVPTWTDDLSALVIGIRKVRKSADKASDAKPGAKEGGESDKGDEASADEKPDLLVWHHKDPKLQSQQQVEEDRDKRYNYVCLYRVADKTFVRLADDTLRNVTLPMTGRWAVGLDDREYALTGSLEGRRFQDVYAVDLHTGARRLAGKKVRWFSGQSPTSNHYLFYTDGHYFVHDLAAGTTANITQTVPTSFVDTSDDHNVVKPPVSPVGWDKTGAFVLLSDGWDVWKVPAVGGGAAINLTGNGRKDAIRYQGRLRLDPEEKGIDLSAPQYFNMYGEWTKKLGIARLTPGKASADVLAWDAAAIGRVAKAKNADTLVFSLEKWTDAPEMFVADMSLKVGLKLTDNGAQQKAFAWSSGAMLIDYVSAKGDKLQGALYLPANYEKGKTYPTLVYIYEKLSQGLNRFSNPSANGFNPSVYTSNGYAVLTPDITYKLNDPGNSAVWCVLPALKAAIATGVIDAAHVGLQGHSWGGYQTAFLVTQSNAFAAAVAGAPLTNMISMYSLIYKNSGGANQAIFESSQGRFFGGYWDNWEAYVRNSPVFFAKNVKTPLIILHNDKDGAVDFTQGVEYYNTLRRLGKNVIMLEYVGENHGLRKPANQQDYTIRMKEFFDHHLKGVPAPRWMTDGVPRLNLEEHLKERAALKKGTAEAKPPEKK